MLLLSKEYTVHKAGAGIYPSNFVSVRRHKKLNLLTEFSNSIFIKFYFKAFWHWKFVQNWLVGFFYFKLFICHSDVIRPKSFRSFTLWTPIKAPLWIRCGAYSTLRPLPAFYNIRKLNLSSKTYISRTA